MTKDAMQFTPTGLRKIIRSYTREAGVRDLERQIAKVCRKNAKRIATGEAPVAKITGDNVSDFLGSPIFTDEVISRGLLPGVAVGLAWTQCGGEILFIETTKMPGVGQLKLTGQLGEVMSESVQIAFSYIRANMEALDVKDEMFQKTDFHVHFPAGATPKDGPSAGITITTSLISLLLGQPIPERLAMTGEITLTGNVLPVGGIKEKVIAAKRAGARTLVMCSKNRRDVDELASFIREGLTFFFVDHYKDVYSFVFKKRCKLDLNNLPKNVLYTPPKSADKASDDAEIDAEKLDADVAEKPADDKKAKKSKKSAK